MFLCNPYYAFSHARDQGKIPFKNILHINIAFGNFTTHHFSRSPLRSESLNIFSVVSANSMKLATKPRMPHFPLQWEYWSIFPLVSKFYKKERLGYWKKSLKFFDIARLVGIAKLSTAGTCVLVVLPPLCFSFAAASPWYTKLLGAGHNNLTINDLTINLTWT